VTKRVVFVNRYFWPDHSATSQIASDLAFHLASRGWDVHVVTSRQRYDDASARLPAAEVERGVRILRVWSARFGRARLIGRAVDYLSFYASAFFAMRRFGRDAVVVPMTDPPLISVVASLATPRIVNWVQDLFPEVAQALGIRTPSLLARLRDWSLRRARVNVVLGTRMAALVPKSVIIHNWADGGLVPVAHEQNELRAEWGLQDSFVVAYSGNLGRAHEFDTILGATRNLPHIRFLIIGGGAKLDSVKASAGANVTFLPYQPREALSRSLSAADVHLVSLQPQLEGLVLPSKFYGALAVGRPVIFIGAADGELARMIREHECGAVVAPGDVERLTNTIAALAADREETAAMGARGREAYLENYAPAHAFARWEETLLEAER
jgi:glycosyltransferase involved in cell wall biosynthesis